MTATEIMIFLPQFGSGGVERVACLLAGGFHRAGAGVHLVTVDRDGPARQIVDPGVPMTHLRLPSFLAQAPRGVKQLAAVVGLVAEIRRRRPALIMSPGNHAHLAVAFAHLLACAPNCRLVLKMTNPLERPGRGGVERRLMRLLHRWLFRRADKVLTLSQSGAARLSRMVRRERNRFAFVHNPYVSPPAGPMERRPSEIPVILAVGRLSRQKNLGLLLTAAAGMADRPWRIVLLGCGPEREALAEQARTLGIEHRVEFAGFVADPRAHYLDAHVLALPSLWEDLPAVAVEAMAAGCPVLATDCSPALTELVLAGSGRIVGSDPTAFASGLAQALEAPFAYAPVEQMDAFSIERGVADHLQVLRAVLSESRRRASAPGRIEAAEAPAV